MSNPKLYLSKAALGNNLRTLISLSGGLKAFPVLKANSYGLGLGLVARFFEEEFSVEEVPLFCVARWQEAEHARTLGVKRELLILSEWPESLQKSGQFQRLPVNTSLMITSLEDLELIVQSKARLSLHLKFNSGMNRLGISILQLKENLDYKKRFEKVLSELKKENAQSIVGLASHLACGEEDPELFSIQQFESFQWCVDYFKSLWGSLPAWIHLSNSPGVASGLFQKTGNFTNAFRPGLHLWGLRSEYKSQLGDDERVSSLKLSRVLTLKAPLRQLYWIQNGESVGYGRHFIARQPTRVGIVNFGYADGLRRMSSNTSLSFAFKNYRFPLLGTVSMDLCAIDLTSAPEGLLEPGVELDWIGDHQSPEYVAHAWKTIPYEVLTSLSSRVERIIE